VTVAAGVALSGQESLAAPFALALILAAVGGLLAAVRAGRATEARRELLHAERLRIARDLHDTVGHGVGAMTVQAGAGRMALAAGAVEDATRAMLGIEEAGRSVLRDVRWMVGLLRNEQEQHRLSDISELVDNARRAGLQVEVEEQGDLSAASPAVGEVAYRVVQEAITNVLRHSTATEVLLRLTRTDQLTVEVHDSGAPVADVLPGNGLRGMQERVREVGGTVEAGPDPAGGWTVVVRLPVSGRKR
jgi:signal transduction histidine kinase